MEDVVILLLVGEEAAADAVDFNVVGDEPFMPKSLTNSTITDVKWPADLSSKLTGLRPMPLAWYFAATSKSDKELEKVVFSS